MDDKDGALRKRFAEEFGRGPEVMAKAPGRINLIGDHTDYNDGYVLPLAIDRTVTVVGTAREDRTVRILSTDYDDFDEFDIGNIERSQETWQNYARGVFWSAIKAGYPLNGVDLAIASDLPQQSGLASSAAFEVAVLAGAAAACGVSVGKQDIALLAQRAENEFVGVQCGIMDQLAVVCGEAGHAMLIDCRSNEIRQVPLDAAEEMAIMVIDSGVSRDLSKTAYNDRREECAEAARQLGLKSLREVNESWLRECQHRMPGELFRRARHVLTENERVLQAAEALRRQDVGTVGKRMFQSHSSLRDDFEVSTPELDSLVEIARQTAGVWGARLTGAGFGGSVVALVRPDAHGDLADRVQREYARPDGRPATVSVLHASNGLRVTNV